MTNPSGIRPTEFNVLVKIDPVSETTRGGIIKPDSIKDREQAMAVKGTLVEVSPLAFGYDTWPVGSQKPEAGQRIALARSSGVEIEGADGEKYRLAKDKDVMAVLDGL